MTITIGSLDSGKRAPFQIERDLPFIQVMSNR